jgi:DnaJ-class molecular chaperone
MNELEAYLPKEVECPYCHGTGETVEGVKCFGCHGLAKIMED